MLTGFLLSLLCGFVPLLFLAGIIYWLDRYEKEPRALLGGVFGWGAIVAVVGALILQIILDQSVMALTGSQVVGQVLGASLFAPVTEEILKGLVVALIFLFARSEFDSILDGIVYASVAALGFAATEDVLYYFSAFNEGGFSALIALVFLRFVIFGWQHAFFTSFFGIGLAVARLNSALWVKIAAPFSGLALAIFAHSLHNTLLTVITGLAGVTAAALVAWTGWLLMGAFILYLVYREKTWLNVYMREEVDLCTITPAQFKMLTTFFGQTNARAVSVFNGRFRKTAHFLQLCGELSHKKRQLATMGDEYGNTRMIEALRAEVGRVSASL